MSDLVQRVQEVLPSVRRDLDDLVRIQSVWADPVRRDEVHRSAEAVAKLLSDAGFGDASTIRRGGYRIRGEAEVVRVLLHLLACSGPDRGPRWGDQPGAGVGGRAG